jgi:uncharacterized cupin superfamily protein
VRLWNDEDSWLFKAVEDGYDDDGVWRTMFSCDCGFVRCFYETEDGLDFVRGNCCVQRTDSVRPCHNG